MKLETKKLGSIYQSIKMPNGHRVVLIEAPTDNSWPKIDCFLNIYCLDATDEIVWQISAPNPRMDTDSFVDLRLENGALKATRFFGSDFEIDPQSGVAKEVGWNK